MSLIIKGIDMPSTCYDCPFESFNRCKFAVMNIPNVAEAKERPTECPLIQIPKGHGRLIDGDELLQRVTTLPAFQTTFEGVPWAVLKDVEVLPEIRHSKAILEAETPEKFSK